MIYEVRLRDVSNADVKFIGSLKPTTIYNFITYVIADNDLDAMKLAVKAAVELRAKSVRSVVAKPMIGVKIAYDALELKAHAKPSRNIAMIFKMLAEPFKAFKGSK